LPFHNTINGERQDTPLAPPHFKYLEGNYQITPDAVRVQAGSTMFSTQAHRRKRIGTFVVYITMAFVAAIVAGYFSQQLFLLLGL
jgi:hypothetical protein